MNATTGIVESKAPNMPELVIVNNKVMAFYDVFKSLLDPSVLCDDVESTIKFLEAHAEEVLEMDASTPEGYKQIKDLAGKLVKLRTTTKKKGETLNEPFKETVVFVKTQYDDIGTRLLKIQNPLTEAYQEIDQAKKRKEEAEDLLLRDALEYVKNLATTNNLFNKTSDELAEIIDELNLIQIDGSWKGYMELAQSAKSSSIDSVTNMQIMVAKQEQQQKEIDAMKASQTKVEPVVEEPQVESVEVLTEDKVEAGEVFITTQKEIPKLSEQDYQAMKEFIEKNIKAAADSVPEIESIDFIDELSIELNTIADLFMGKLELLKK